MAAKSIPGFDEIPREKSFTSDELDDPNKKRGTERALNGPLAAITTSSYWQGIKAFAVATTAAVAVDQILCKTPVGLATFPNFRHIQGQYRFYGWTLACIGYFQYNVEDTQITSIMKRNEAKFIQEDKQDQMDYFKSLEAKELKKQSQQPQTPPVLANKTNAL